MAPMKRTKAKTVKRKRAIRRLKTSPGIARDLSPATIMVARETAYSTPAGRPLLKGKP